MDHDSTGIRPTATDERAEPARAVLNPTALSIAAAVAAGLLGLRAAFGYPIFHVVVELFTVAVGVGVFMVAWNGRHYVRNDFYMVIGAAFLGSGLVDLIHTLTYKGMNVLPGVNEFDVPTQLWLLARALQVAGLVLAPSFVRGTRGRGAAILTAFVTVALLGMADILTINLFPTALEPVTGLTPFKVVTEYVLIALLGLALVRMRRVRDSFDRGVYLLFQTTIALTIISEASFTLYQDPFGALNMLGHLLKLGAFFTAYRAMLVVALRDPFAVLLREVKEREDLLVESESRFRQTFEQASAGVGFIGLDDRWLSVNRKFEEITGRSRAELADLRVADVTHPEDSPRDTENARLMLSGALPEATVEKRYVRPDGSIVWVNATRTLVRAADSSPSHYVAIVTDITRRKELEDAERRGRELADALNVIDNAVAASLDLSAMMGSVAALVVGALRADSASVLMRQPGGWVLAHGAGALEDAVGGTFTDTDAPIAVAAESTGEVVAVPDMRHADGLPPDTEQVYGVRATLAVPLLSRGATLGVLFASYHGGPHAFSPEELEFADRLATTIGLAIENMRLYEGQRHIADVLQSALLQVPEQMAGVRMAQAYRSATELARIGGDFYDVFAPMPGVVSFLVGDISGKGIEAAALTHIARSTIRAFAYRDPHPASVLTHVNDVLSKQLAEGSFMTALYCVLEVTSGRLSIASAGHPDPVLCTMGTCGLQEVERGVPLGVCAGWEYKSSEIVLQAGETVLLYTDGLTDARSGGEFFGEERIHETVTGMGDADPEGLVTGLLEAASRFAGGSPPDDIAIVAVRYVGPETELENVRRPMECDLVE